MRSKYDGYSWACKLHEMTFLEFDGPVSGLARFPEGLASIEKVDKVMTIIAIVSMLTGRQASRRQLAHAPMNDCF